MGLPTQPSIFRRTRRLVQGAGRGRVAVALVVAVIFLAGCTGDRSDPGRMTVEPRDTTIRIEGIVRDAATMSPLDAVRITLTTNTGFNGVYVTRADGAFTFILEPAASCRMELTRAGYFAKTLNGECLGAGQVDVLMAASRSPASSEPPEPQDPAPDDPPPASQAEEPKRPEPPRPPLHPVPHVVVGVPDSGINAYHEIYRRPHLTKHPCTYVPDYPCDVPALELTFDAPTWEDAFKADEQKWAAIKPGDRFWIPGTNIIGAICQQPYQGSTIYSTGAEGVDHCILDDSHMHGTGTSSSVLTENPDALLIVVEGNSGGARLLVDGTFPVDVVSFSWGAPVPLVGVGLALDYSYSPLFVAGSGNEGAFPVALDGTKAHTNIITVGAADAGSRSEPGYSGWKTMDFVSEYCRPTAQTRSFTEMREQYCGTSFSAPTFAGALSAIILEVRRSSGYTGGVRDGFVDPILGITTDDVRRALNHTATYEPEDAFDDTGHPVPVVAPWYQWGWGYVARNEVAAGVACLLEDVCPERPTQTVAYMEALWELRRTQSGEGP